jgi:hypothetical protein
MGYGYRMLNTDAVIAEETESSTSKPLAEHLDDIPGSCSVMKVQRTAVLGTQHVLRTSL